MRALSLFALLLLPLHASASPELCMRKVEAKYLQCHQGCGTMGDGEIDCIRGCAIAYSIGKRECQRGSLALEPLADWGSDGGCKQMTSSHDGRIRFLCMGDGAVYDTYGQCRTYCR